MRSNLSGTEKVFFDSIMKDKDHITSIMESIIEITKIINSIQDRLTKLEKKNG